MASSNTMGIYEKGGRRFKMTREHAERVGATPVKDEGGASTKQAQAAKNKLGPEPENKSGDGDLTNATKAELVAAAEARGLDTSGTKAELLERLTADS